ncbi:Proline utilization trans-activator [Sphaerulina musiva]
MDDDDIVEPPEKRLRVPRRTPRACKQCRSAKIKCSGTAPCARCARRREHCVFPSDEPHVSVPQTYLEHLERRVAQQSKSRQRSSPSDFTNASIRPAEEAPQDASRGLLVLAEASSTASAIRPVDAANHSVSGIGTEEVTDHLAFHNPLVSKSLPYVRDVCGRPRYLGPTSTWAFCRRALFVLGPHSPGAFDNSAGLNNDGTAFRLRWVTKPSVEPSDLNNLPAADYARYLYDSVKFRLGELFGIVDEANFMSHFELFHRHQWQVASTQRLWFVEYLLILAYGKALLSHPDRSAVPGSEFAARAMALLPDAAQLHEDGPLAIEVLALVALYFQSIDMRVTAYQYIGQALRLCYVEGIHLHIPDDVISSEFSLRCKKVFWVTYVLDRELSSLMGAIMPVAEENITAFIAPDRQTSILDKALMLRVRISRLIATTCTTLYSVDERFGTFFVKNTTWILHRLAEVSHEIENVMNGLNQPSKCEMPHMITRIMLSYHHCIVLAIRPLVMWLLISSLPPAASAPQQLAAPISALLHTAVNSATTMITTLKNLTEQGLLETFLPFQLEYAFSSGMLLSILGSILPSYISDDNNWNHTLHFILDEMTKKSNVVAPLRKFELQTLHRLLDPVRTQEPLILPGLHESGYFSGQNVAVPPPPPNNNNTTSPTDPEHHHISAAAAAAPTTTATLPNNNNSNPPPTETNHNSNHHNPSNLYISSSSTTSTWDSTSLYDLVGIGPSAQPELMLELAAQLAEEDFDPSQFLLGPVE